MSPQAWPPANTNGLFSFIASSVGLITPSRSQTKNINMPPRKNPANSPTTSNKPNKRDDKTNPTSQSKAEPAPSSTDMSNRYSTASTMSTITTLAAAEIVEDAKKSLDRLGESYDDFADQMTTIAQLGAELEAAEMTNRLRKMMDAEDERLDKEFAGIRALQTEVLQKDVVEHLKIAVGQGVSDLIDELVAEQVKALLPQHIRPELLAELARHKQELAEVERDLHNSESRRMNAQIRTGGLSDPLRIILKDDGTVSKDFPKDLQTLLGMKDKSIESLMKEYHLTDISKSQDTNVNRLMRFLGLSYQLVRSPISSPRPRT
ncbi:uncharacterized protein B0H18DRAFT_1041404 [Fomitopsis serialis]|uniref:uncharacterized protein n=1 Tax=Fomitopsis serialis TaxID=139415 RepID=UPI002007AE11|nr:uncharacterized protein B0H18DRAFT_1041404 [Neoantrodia serialis]KAH9915483.1 hypothetical protein B0H18DRAFT_1041404 [Neoantrodia serialis]